MFSFPKACILALGVCGVQSRYQVIAIKEIGTMYQVRVYFFRRKECLLEATDSRIFCLSTRTEIHCRTLSWPSKCVG